MTAPATPAAARRLTAVLAALSAVSPFSSDMYAPGFPEIVASFRTTGAAVQLSLTACLIGFACGQVVIGPVSDAIGRRRLLLGGSAAFAVLSLACAAAPSIVLFDVARLLQGIAGSAGAVLARAVVGDLFSGARAARQFSTQSVIAMTAPIVAPVIGGLVLGVAPWRVVFVILAGTGLLLVLGIRAWVPESLPPARRRTGGLRPAFAAMGGLLRRREFVGHVLVMSCALAALFAYITGAPFVFQDGYGLSATEYGLVYAANAVGTVLAGVLVGRLAGRVRYNAVLVAGVGIALVSVLALATALLLGVDAPAVTWPCLAGLTFGFGLVLPASITIVLTAGRDTPGAAAGVLGCSQFLFGAAAAPLSGALGGTTTGSTTAVVLAFVAASAVALMVLARPWRGHGEP